MNISVSEIIVVLLIALIVIKPEQLPGAAFTLGRFIKSLRGMANKMKQEVHELIEPVEKIDERK